MFAPRIVFVIAAAACGVHCGQAPAQGPLTTAFTYQGVLKQGGNLASGLFDVRFRLYDALTGGTPQGGVECEDNISLVEGQFTVSLDFGAQFNGQRRFLEVEVRSDAGSDCSVGSGYSLLSPRQELAAAPYALYALGANATEFNGQAASFYTNASNLSSGTLSAARLPMPLSIAGNPPGGNIQEIFSVQSTNADYGVGIRSTAKGIGLISSSTGTTGFTYGGQFLSASSDGTALLAHATSTTGTNIGISAKTDSADGTAIAASADHPSGGTMGIIGSVVSPQGFGVYGLAPMHALFGQAYNSGGRGIETMAPADGYAGYFNGRGYFSDKVGMGTTSPASGLHVVRNWDGEDGALRVEASNQAALRMTGGPITNNSSWLLFVSSGGPGNFDFYNRTGPATWAPIMTLTPGGNMGIGTTGPGRALHVSDNDLFTARFANGNATAAVVEFQNVASNAVWEYGVAGSSPPFPGLTLPLNIVAGSMYIYKQGQPKPAILIDPSGIVRTQTLQAVNLSAGSLNWTDAVGVSGRGNTHGVWGATPSTSSTSYGVYGAANGASPWAVFADGNLGSNGSKSFRIDHPADPQNKYLLHYCAESPEVINFYSGTVLLDAKGEAEVQLPPYFAAINRDPRYSLTAVGAPMPNLHVAWEIDAASLDAGARVQPGDAIPVCWFRIAGGVAGAKVSWEVKAVRNDRWMQQNGAPVEQDKGADRGSYQRPELYGEPASMLPASHPNHPDHPLAKQSVAPQITD